MKKKDDILVGKPERKRTLGTPRHRWENNIKMNLKEILFNWIHLAQDRNQSRVLVSNVM
jgi:hypothetical protein